MARNPKLTPEIQKTICDAVSCGLPRVVAAGAAGIDDSTLYRWIERGRDGKSPYREFCDDLARADHEAHAALVRQAHRHAITDARTCQWLLTRKYPDFWGDMVKHEIHFAGMNDAELDTYITEGKRALGETGGSGGGPAGAAAAAGEPGD